MGSFSPQAAAAGTCSSTFRLLSGPASVRSTRDKPSSTRSRAIRERVRGQPQGQVTVLPTQPAEFAASSVEPVVHAAHFLRSGPVSPWKATLTSIKSPALILMVSLGRMRCNGDRCAALVGDVGVLTACTIYTIRPDVCRACLPGDDPAKWHTGTSISKGVS